VRVQEWPFAGAIDVLREQTAVRAAYDQLVTFLLEADPPRHGKVKHQPRFVYDQTGLADDLRLRLKTVGWQHGDVLSGEMTIDGVRLPPVRADMVKGPTHVVFEFGNVASFAHNLLTRVTLAAATQGIRLTVLVTPTSRFARLIDSNLAAFERVAGEMSRLADAHPEAIPGPLMVVGVEPD
jgi:hypothetical protein